MVDDPISEPLTAASTHRPDCHCLSCTLARLTEVYYLKETGEIEIFSAEAERLKYEKWRTEFDKWRTEEEAKRG